MKNEDTSQRKLLEESTESLLSKIKGLLPKHNKEASFDNDLANMEVCVYIDAEKAIENDIETLEKAFMKFKTFIDYFHNDKPEFFELPELFWNPVKETYLISATIRISLPECKMH